jgi:hypothetical protein
MALSASLENISHLFLQSALYLLFLKSSAPMDLIFNCMGLNFVMELDNLFAKGNEVALRGATTRLAAAQEKITHDDYLMYATTDDAVWAEFGLHNVPKFRVARKIVDFFLLVVVNVSRLFVLFATPFCL